MRNYLNTPFFETNKYDIGIIGYLHGLQPTWAETRSASQWSLQMYNLIPLIIFDFHCEWTYRSTTLPCTTIRVFFCLVNFLAHGIKYFVLILSFKARYGFKNLNFLLHQQLINLCQIFQATRNLL